MVLKRACTAQERALRIAHSRLLASQAMGTAITLEEIRLLGVVVYKLDLELKSRKVS